MNKVLIGCGVLLALGVLTVIALVAFGPALFRKATAGKLVGSIAIEQVQVQPEAPSPDDAVSLRVAVVFAGVGTAADGRLELPVTAEKKGEAEKHGATAALTRAAGAGPSGVAQGTATIDLGQLPEGTHTFIVSVQPAQELIGAVEPPREVRVVVKPKANP
jgi:hypothetical protein